MLPRGSLRPAPPLRKIGFAVISNLGQRESRSRNIERPHRNGSAKPSARTSPCWRTNRHAKPAPHTDRSPSGAICWRAAIVFVPAILYPFGGVAGSVKQPETVRSKGAGRRSLSMGLLPQSSQLAWSGPAARPHQNGEVVPARAAYSHQLRGRRYFLPVCCASHATNAFASSQLIYDGPAAPPPSTIVGWNLHPPAVTQASHSANVISRRPIARERRSQRGAPVSR